MSTSHGSCQEIPPSGLTVLVDPEQPSFDIVFVHGFTGHPQRTWIHKKGQERHDGEPNSKSRKFNPFSTSGPSKDHSQSVYWPVDLLPSTIPGARVLTYGYDTHIRHWLGPPVNTSSVYDISRDFLVALEDKRREGSSRPVLFIAHSLGGIVVKEMLRRSNVCRSGQPHLHTVFKSTAGIMFFGTPHSGADPRGFLHRIVEKVVKVVGYKVNEQIVNTLLPSSERLKELRDEFGSMAHEQKWIIHSFQEQFGVMALGNQKVVEDMSSYLNIPVIETTEHIGRNHMDMCRFSGPSDVDYTKVSAALLRMTAAAPMESEKPGPPILSQKNRKALLDSLSFNQIDARHMTIKAAHAKTCNWLLTKIEYLDWISTAKFQEHRGLLWIKGKPGTGKSTLMKFILATARRRMKDKTIISFFFNARGDDLEKSTTGMYRSLLLQLLERIPTLQHVFDNLQLVKHNAKSIKWSIESLKELFEQVILGLDQISVVCIIDALDECDEREIRDMVSFFEHIGELAVSNGLQFNVCFSSRHYPHITIRAGLTLDLEGQEGHNQDLANYIDSELKIGQSKVAKEIRTELQEKASGVFMWVVLVVVILNKAHDCGNIHKLKQTLREIPKDLHELFHDILTRGNQNGEEQNNKQIILCIEWVLFSKHPLKPKQLYFAIVSGAEPDDLFEYDSEEIGIEYVEKFILHSSKGLTEVTKLKDPTVQFIHESVINFLRKENGLAKIWPELGNNFEGTRNQEIKQCCHRYMNFAYSRLDLEDPLPAVFTPEAATLRESASQRFPLLPYAVQNILYHADIAEGCGISQVDFMQVFRLPAWVELDNLFKKYRDQRHRIRVSLLYILAELNCPNLININPLISACFDEEDERYGTPLFAAMSTESDKTVAALTTNLEKRYDPHHLISQLPPQSYWDRKVVFGTFRPNFTYNEVLGVCGHLAKYGNDKLFVLLLLVKNSMPDSRDRRDLTLLHRAASSGYVRNI